MVYDAVKLLQDICKKKLSLLFINIDGIERRRDKRKQNLHTLTGGCRICALFIYFQRPARVASSSEPLHQLRSVPSHWLLGVGPSLDLDFGLFGYGVTWDNGECTSQGNHIQHASPQCNIMNNKLTANLTQILDVIPQKEVLKSTWDK